jgi:hypothetical protein
MYKSKQVYYWPVDNKKKVIVEEVQKPVKEFKNIIKKEENLE